MAKDTFKLTEGKGIKNEVVAYCKHCNRPRLIVNGLCPGCLKYGNIIFDADINPIKLMALNSNEPQEQSVVVLNPTQYKIKELVKAFESAGIKVIENKPITKQKDGDT